VNVYSLGSGIGLRLGDLNGFVGSLVSRLQLLDELEGSHAHNDAAEDHVLVVEEGQGCAHSNVELRLVGVAQTVSLAHTEHANLLVLQMERLVLESAAIDGSAKLRGLIGSDLSHLDVHTLDDAMNISAHVANLHVVGALVTIAETEEVSDGTGSNIIEKFEVNGRGDAREAELQLGVLACLGGVDHLLESVSSKALVNNAHRVVHVGEVVKDVGSKLLAISNVLRVVKDNEMGTRVLIEDSLQLVGCSLDIFLPLGFEELEALNGDRLWVLFLKVLGSSHTLVEGRILDLTSDREFARLHV